MVILAYFGTASDLRSSAIMRSELSTLLLTALDTAALTPHRIDS